MRIKKRIFNNVKLFFQLLSFIFVLASCNPTINSSIHANQKYAPLSKQKAVTVIPLFKDIPSNTRYIGAIKIGETGFTKNCDYDYVISLAKDEARKQGGNLIRIIKHYKPDFMSGCHRIEALVFYQDSTTAVAPSENLNQGDTSNGYATIYFYRDHSVTRALVSYNVYLGNDVVYRCRNNTKREVRIGKEGRVTLRARLETSSEVSFIIEKGKTYYIKCSVARGIATGRPELRLVERPIGKSDYLNNSLREKQKPLVVKSFESEEILKTKIAGRNYQKDYDRFVLSASAGYSHRTAQMPTNRAADFTEYINGLKDGFSFTSDFSYFFNEMVGLGLKYQQSSYSNEAFLLLLTDQGNSQTIMSDQISIRYYGLNLSTRYLFGQSLNHSITARVGLGYTDYTNNSVLGSSLKIEGSTLGTNIDIIYNYYFSKNWGIHLETNAIGASLNRVQLTNSAGQQASVDLGANRESLVNINFNIGLTYRF